MEHVVLLENAGEVATFQAPNWVRTKAFLRNTEARWFMTILASALVYILAAKLGLTLAHSTKQATTIWPVTGIALVFLTLWGYRYWPGIYLGAFAINLLTDEPVIVAAAIALGNTLEALISAYIIRSITRLNVRLKTVRDVVSFVVLVALGSTAVSASIGVLSLTLGKLVLWDNTLTTWQIWWVGDAMGDLIIAPLLFAIASSSWPRLRESRRTVFEIAIMLALLLAVCTIAYTTPNTTFLPYHARMAIIVPFVIWAALRFKVVGTVSTMIVAIATATWATVAGLGPFTDPQMPLDTNLVNLQLYMLVMTVTGLIIAAVASSRDAAEQLARTHRAASERSIRILSDILNEVSPRRAKRNARARPSDYQPPYLPPTARPGRSRHP